MPKRAKILAGAALQIAETPTPPQLKDDITSAYITSTQLRARYGHRSEMWVERIMATDPNFPRPIKIGRFRFWERAALEAYERSLIKRGAA
jgi:hypothetical protein